MSFGASYNKGINDPSFQCIQFAISFTADQENNILVLLQKEKRSINPCL